MPQPSAVQSQKRRADAAEGDRKQRPHVDTMVRRTKGPGSATSSSSSPSGKRFTPPSTPSSSPLGRNTTPSSAHAVSSPRASQAAPAKMNAPPDLSDLIESCVFCMILRGTTASTIIQDWDDAVCFIPHKSVTPGHVLVVPKPHVRNGHEDKNVTAAAVLCAMDNPHKLMRRGAAHLGTALPKDTEFHYNTLYSWGEDATQSVFHLHIHLVPRVKGDALPIMWTDQPAGCHNTTGKPAIKASKCEGACSHRKQIQPMTKEQQVRLRQVK